MVITEFIEFVEDRFGDEVTDRMFEFVDLPHGGVYTAVGSYDVAEMVAMLTWLSEESGVPVPELLRTFGHRLFDVLHESHQAMLAKHTTAFDLLRMLDGHIHVEVRKLYSDAELPSFKVIDRADGALEMHYQSSRGLPDLAQGLMERCLAVFGVDATITRETLSDDGTDVRFTLTPVGHP